MKPTHYFLELGNCNMMKSKLHEAIRSYFNALSGTIIEVAELETMKHIFTEKVKSLNAEFKRCKPVELRFHSYSLEQKENKSVSVHGIEGMNFSLKPATMSSTTLILTNF